MSSLTQLDGINGHELEQTQVKNRETLCAVVQRVAKNWT